MNSFCIFLLACFSSGFSIMERQPIEPKLCKNCKFFVKENFFTSNQYGRCSAFVYEQQDNFLVDGIHKKKITNYFYCSTARNFDNMCGVEGKKFEPSTFRKS